MVVKKRMIAFSNTLLTTIYSLFYPTADCPKNSAVWGQQQPGVVRGAAGAVAGTKARVAGLAAHLLPSSLHSLLHFIFKRRQCPRSVSDSPGMGRRTVHLPPSVICVLLRHRILLI